ncbi:MAG: YkvA family protein [Spongiibacter sp.]|uniref:DUF1232 domain-containing protein n=1 Tax=Spongiibacter thalassae TaxID=2721624 RepID=A0ABX1GET6_9GAMM|nr:YkvA family protein [Spongiibacter thalassae]MDX1504710.1 YkvA family protein [Spongiibacter sp.]NKI17460.1 DUF1232 domain-containing protein [Spongiibacter thalassae]
MKYFSQRKARKILDKGAENSDSETLESTLEKRSKIMEKVINSGQLAPYLAQVSTLFNLLQDYVRGEYREIPWWSLGAVSTALLYIFIPMDAIPDIVPIAGFIDDAAVLALCLELVGKDLAIYRQHADARANNSDSPSPGSEKK